MKISEIINVSEKSFFGSSIILLQYEKNNNHCLLGKPKDVLKNLCLSLENRLVFSDEIASRFSHPQSTKKIVGNHLTYFQRNGRTFINCFLVIRYVDCSDKDGEFFSYDGVSPKVFNYANFSLVEFFEPFYCKLKSVHSSVRSTATYITYPGMSLELVSGMIVNHISRKSIDTLSPSKYICLFPKKMCLTYKLCLGNKTEMEALLLFLNTFSGTTNKNPEINFYYFVCFFKGKDIFVRCFLHTLDKDFYEKESAFFSYLGVIPKIKKDFDLQFFLESFNETIFTLADHEENAITLSNIFEDIIRTE
jgi:hypothetical protein